VPMSSTELEAALGAAAEASRRWGRLPAADRARALRRIADALDQAGHDLVPLAQRETQLPAPRLRGELARTTFQLRLFARELDGGACHGVIVDRADPDWPTGPRPELRRMLIPLGPVAVFAASNFPFAFSVAGGDTAAALAAGCPVVLKAHPGHPQLSDRTGEIVSTALAASGAPEGTFAVVHGVSEGRELVLNPRIRAVAFTGSHTGGRALFDLAVSRPDPIPFYGELGSLNPVFVTERAARARGAEIAAGYVDSYTLGAGQFCTKPGLLLVPSTSDITERAVASVLARSAAPLLNARISAGYASTLATLTEHDAIDVLVAGVMGEDGPTPTLLSTSVSALLAHRDVLLAECFGPTSLVVHYASERELLDVAAEIEGQLTATVHGDDHDEIVPPLLEELVERAGRVLWNGWPTGVSVTPAMHHGGPYPATTSVLHTSVGTEAIRRFLRPVVFQNMPTRLLPEPLRTPPVA
jgi:NADP-dependent aldehyde dehydrogenase